MSRVFHLEQLIDVGCTQELGKPVLQVPFCGCDDVGVFPMFISK